VGLYLERKTGDPVKRGDILCQIHWNDKTRLGVAMPLIEAAFEVKSRPPERRPLVHAVLES
jgi:thymidine phosphorylase